MANSPKVNSNNHGSVLGNTVRLVGTIQGDGALVIEGSVRGDVDVAGPVEVAEGASVQGDVTAESLNIRGTLHGDARAQDVIAIGPRAVVRGSLTGTQLSVESGAQLVLRMNSEFELDLHFEMSPKRRR